MQLHLCVEIQTNRVFEPNRRAWFPSQLLSNTDRIDLWHHYMEQRLKTEFAMALHLESVACSAQQHCKLSTKARANLCVLQVVRQRTVFTRGSKKWMVQSQKQITFVGNLFRVFLALLLGLRVRVHLDQSLISLITESPSMSSSMSGILPCGSTLRCKSGSFPPRLEADHLAIRIRNYC